jgi:hypothetical protein
MVRSFLERSQHEYAVLHLRYAETRNSKDLSLQKSTI